MLGMYSSHRRDPYRLLPLDPASRTIARDLYERVADKPILSPHGHVPAEVLLADRPFENPAELVVTNDHYVTRLLHAAGVPLEDLGVGGGTADPREIWRLLASRWHLFAGTASGYWIEEELSSVLGIDEPLSATTADATYDAVVAALATPQLRPRALFERFGIEVLATTDDPLDPLDAHAALAESDLGGRVVPTFRPDAYLDPDAVGFTARLDRLLASAAVPATFAGYLDALAQRRAYFVARGAVSADHGVLEPLTVELDAGDAERLFAQVAAGTADAEQRRAFRAHMLLRMAQMSVDDGLVMTVHAGVLRNYSTATFGRFGADTGHDIPVPTSFVHGMRPLLERFGLHPDFHLVLFSVDETTWSRELAPLAGFYPSVYVGAPWWFFDAPDAMARHFSAVVETAGFSRMSGFIDDTRAFLSIPARHDTARRAQASFLARLVAEGRVRRADADLLIDDLVDGLPRRVFKL